jgi:maltooligosyltrehalose trehalohydrolase
VGTFTAEGTYMAAAGKLRELAELGITAIELMPVAAFPGRFGWGYDGVLPFAPHAAYGTPDELKHLVQEAHRLGMMVFMDVVYNHFGPSGNYLGRYAPQFFSETHHSPWGAAINFDGAGSRTVRDFFIANAVYWVTEYRIDGLRLDAVHAITDGSQPHVLEEISEAVRAAAHGRHVHLVLENENNDHHRLAQAPEPGRYDAQWNDDFHHVLHVALTGETQRYYHDYGDQPMNQLARCLTHGMLFESSKRREGGARIHIRETPPQPLGAMVNFAHNHDQVGNRPFGERLSVLAEPGAAPLATLLALLTPAVPMLFQGEEWGSTTPFLYFADWGGELREAVREGRKREFGHQAQTRDGRPVTLPDPCDASTFAASRPDPTERGTDAGLRWQAMVRDALTARKLHITPHQQLLATGEHTAHIVGGRGLEACWRYRDGNALLLELNLGSQPIQAGPRRSVLSDAKQVFVHAWPDGTPEGTWPAWAARWTRARVA